MQRAHWQFFAFDAGVSCCKHPQMRLWTVAAAVLIAACHVPICQGSVI